MRKGTFSVQTANPNSAKHNSRELAPKYLIDTSAKNYYELLKKDDDFILEAQAIYKEKIKQTMQKKQVENLIQETVLTLQPNQDEKDVKDLFKKLNQKYGGHELLEVAIHRDEGYFLKDDIAYYPTKNILNKNGDWYVCSDNSIKKPKQDDFDRIVNIDEFEKVYNYHAHAKFSMFDRETGKTARMQKKDMSSRIKFVSEHLKLEYNPSADRHIKKSVNQIKDEHLAKARTMEHNKTLEKDLLATKDQLKDANNQLRTFMKENGALRTDFAQLEQAKKELEEKLKAKELTIEEMQDKFKEIEENFRREKGHLESVVELKEIEIDDLRTKNYQIETFSDNLENQNKVLISQNEILEEKVLSLEEKTAHSSNMSDYEAMKEDLKSIDKNIDTFENHFKLPKTGNLVKLMQWVETKFSEMKTQIKSLFQENQDLKEEIEFLKMRNEKLIDEKADLLMELGATDVVKNDDPLQKLVKNLEVATGSKSDSSILDNTSSKIRRER